MAEHYINAPGEPSRTTYIILSIISSVIFTIFILSDGLEGYRLDMRFISVPFICIASAVCSYIGIKIGIFFRRVAMPEKIKTNGELFGNLQIKFYWYICPQIGGAFAGGLLGAMLAAAPFVVKL